MVIDTQEGIGGHERHPLVTVYKSVIRDETVTVGCSKTSKISALLVCPPIPGSIQCRFDQPLLPNSETAAVVAYLVGVDDAYDRA